MRIIGVRITEQDGSGRRTTWAAEVEDLDTAAPGTAQLICPVVEFWENPSDVMSGPRRGEVVIGGVDGVEVVPPVLPEARVICIGLNYADHVAEGSYADQDYPPVPTLFARWTRSLVAGGVSAPVNANERGLDWEGEIAAWVGAELCDVDADTAREAVLGYSTFNDLTSRIAQKLTSQWILGKNGDRSGPIGPLVTRDEVGDLRAGLKLETRVNGTIVQQSTTDRQIYELGETLAHISRTMTLHPGDIICTGTPSGVGYARTPEWLLQPGDVVEVEAEGLGILRTPVSGPDSRP